MSHRDRNDCKENSDQISVLSKTDKAHQSLSQTKSEQMMHLFLKIVKYLVVLAVVSSISTSLNYYGQAIGKDPMDKNEKDDGHKHRRHHGERGHHWDLHSRPHDPYPHPYDIYFPQPYQVHTIRIDSRFDDPGSYPDVLPRPPAARPEPALPPTAAAPTTPIEFDAPSLPINERIPNLDENTNQTASDQVQKKKPIPDGNSVESPVQNVTVNPEELPTFFPPFYSLFECEKCYSDFRLYDVPANVKRAIQFIRIG